MGKQIFVAAVGLALLASCSGGDDAEERVEVVEVEVIAAPAEEARPGQPLLSGVERKRRREAQQEFGLGFELLYGRKRPHDPKQAHVHLLKAAELGHPRSQGLVGVSYMRGRGTERDPAEGVRWLTIGAENGWPHAQLKLGEAYRDGVGVEHDPVEALMWLALAGRSGSIAASMIASSYAQSLPPDQRQEGFERVRAWRIEHGMAVKKRPEEAEAAGPQPAVAPSAAENQKPEPARPAAGA